MTFSDQRRSVVAAYMTTFRVVRSDRNHRSLSKLPQYHLECPIQAIDGNVYNVVELARKRSFEISMWVKHRGASASVLISDKSTIDANAC